MSDEFRNNCEKWARFHRDQAKALLEMSPEHVILQKNGSANLKILVDGRERFYHSQENPEEEARRWFRDLSLSDEQLLFIYGVGLGYVYDYAKEWLRADKERFLILFEDDLEVIYHLFHTPRGGEILENRQVWLAFLDPTGKALNLLAEGFVSKTFKVKASNLYGEIHKDVYRALKAKISSYINLLIGSPLEYSDYGRLYFAQFFRNLLLLPEALLASSLFGKFAGIPAIICGSGPSLTKNLPILTTLRDRALILAGGSAINAINTAGLLPHMGVGIDSHSAQFNHLLMNQAFDIPYFYRNRFLTEGLKLVHGQHLYVNGSEYDRVSRWFDEKLGIKHLVDIKEGYSEQDFALSLAYALGCNPIILVGFDLAYTDEKSTIGGIFNHPLHYRSAYEDQQIAGETPIAKLDIYGEGTYTSWKWVAESLWIGNFSKLHSNKRILNATEGGIGAAGTPHKTLKEVADLFLKESYDFEGMLHQQMEEAKTVFKIGIEQIEPLMRQFLQSLERCENYCRAIQQNCKETELAFRAGREVPPLSEKGLRAFEQMAEEPAYDQLLHPFARFYRQSHTQESDQTIYEALPLGFQEIEIRKAQLNQARYGFLIETIQVNKDILKKALQERTSLAPKHPAGHCSEGTIYSFEKGMIQINDPEMGLDIKEPFHPDPNSTKRQYGPNGQLISEQFYQEGLLHGPSSFFNQKGALLALHWFLRGKRVGKAISYTSGGKISSIYRWQEGVLDGKQEAFYSNGQFKSILQYSVGKLHGDVLLYYPSGELKRELAFDSGKRHGFERLWNESGQLTIEAEYDQGKPKGVARQWYANGQLAFEISYDQEGLNGTVREWDEAGTATRSETLMVGDYFDQVALQTTKLTDALSEVMDQVDTLAPLVETLVPGEFSMKSNEPEIETIKKEIENLKRISQDLIKESGFDLTHDEDLTVEKQVQDMAQQISKDMNTIQNSLSTTLEALTKKLKLEEEKRKEQKKDG
jgi:antitoxin component YwqK of YwqJK toxin-antitoxin module